MLDDGDNLRIMPMVGAGGGRNIRDIRFMKGVDLAITRPSLLARMRQSGEIGPIDDKIVYLTKLFNEEMPLVVRADAGVASIEHLAGRTVNLGESGSGTQSIAREVFSVSASRCAGQHDRARAVGGCDPGILTHHR